MCLVRLRNAWCRDGGDISITVLPSLLKAMRQRDVGVRQRAVHCLQALLLRSPAAFRTVLPDVCSRLRDGDLGVVEATVTLIYSQLDHNGHRFPADLGLTLLSLLYKVIMSIYYTCHAFYSQHTWVLIAVII